MTETIRGRDIINLFRNVQRLARTQPSVFIGGAFALGFFGARFIRSARTESADSDDDPWGQAAGRPDSAREYRSYFSASGKISAGPDEISQIQDQR